MSWKTGEKSPWLASIKFKFVRNIFVREMLNFLAVSGTHIRLQNSQTEKEERITFRIVSIVFTSHKLGVFLTLIVSLYFFSLWGAFLSQCIFNAKVFPMNCSRRSEEKRGGQWNSMKLHSLTGKWSASVRGNNISEKQTFT